MTKFNEEDVKEINRLYNNGLSCREIAEKFNVTQPAIKYRVKNFRQMIQGYAHNCVGCIYLEFRNNKYSCILGKCHPNCKDKKLKENR